MTCGARRRDTSARGARFETLGARAHPSFHAGKAGRSALAYRGRRASDQVASHLGGRSVTMPGSTEVWQGPDSWADEIEEALRGHRQRAILARENLEIAPDFGASERVHAQPVEFDQGRCVRDA